MAKLVQKNSAAYARELTKLRSELKAEVKAELENQRKLDEAERGKLATWEDVADVRLEIETLRSETKTEIERLCGETRARERCLILWVGGIGGTGFLGLAGIMAKGFR